MVSGTPYVLLQLNNVFAPEQIYCRTSNGDFGREDVVSTFANERDHHVLFQWGVQGYPQLENDPRCSRNK
jgi:hypothetical protein